MSKKRRFELLLLFSNLLDGGFTLTEVCYFLERIERFPREIVQEMTENFISGDEVSSCFAQLGFSSAQTTQLELAQMNGNLKETMQVLKNQAIEEKRQREKLVKILSYPLLLLIFLFGIMGLLREFLLPQLMSNNNGEKNFAFLLIEYLPAIVLITGGGVVFFTLLLLLFLKRKSAVFRAKWWCKIPIIRTFYRLYLTSVLSREWGYLFLQGHEMKTIVEIMENLKSNGLLRELGREMGTRAEEGISFDVQVGSWQFVQSTFSVIILSGEVKSRLGEELLFYSEMCFQELLALVEKRMSIVQPLVFLFVALMILGIYAAILLPIYNNMEGMV